ncbi:cyclopropane-fatty-acyl-phospholipid synthase family protein [Oceanicola sp. 502str15]|uniref:SAM-dependent methyltransferase n=1 Tax=Oceanicola sp. 502str15 TaxID=2696061 RepID=UPI002095A712|nr:cyclopropane-fatty-acyl-phospholipid synthase family protein [Oceanicola sp. 502str15]MCO6383429.1 methyltransferase domain-containing protein [Oceanicola sp. 502str15]
MWKAMIDRLLRGMIADGLLVLKWPDGSTSRYGPGGEIEVKGHLKDESILRDIALRPQLAIGEGYMDGRLVLENDDCYGFLALMVRNLHRGTMPPWFRAADSLRIATRALATRNGVARSGRNVRHHYDISDDLYARMLGEDMQYSCAYFARPGLSLEQAQAAKKAHIAGKLLLEPGMRVLDIGCGWGGMAMTLVRDYGARVVGVTLSENQLATARARAEKAGLAGQVEFRLMDYRKLDERFDRVVSVGMLEHVGLPQFPTYFQRVHDLLAPGGVALIHAIGNLAKPHATSPWLAKYIFPGGYIPAQSELAPAIEKARLATTDLEVWRGHYGPTLHAWRDRFEASLDWVRTQYDERFIRMWRFYLCACEAAFEEGPQAVFHYQLARDQYAVPVTRDYLYSEDAAQMLHAAQ